MAASYQSKDSAVLGQQLAVQSIVLKANSPLLSVSGSDLALQLNETPSAVLSCIKQVAAGTLSGIACTISGTQIIVTGESAAVASTVYIIRYIIAE